MTENEWYELPPGLQLYIAQQIAAAVPARSRVEIQMNTTPSTAGGDDFTPDYNPDLAMIIGTGLALNADNQRVDVVKAGDYMAWATGTISDGSPTAFQVTIRTPGHSFSDQTDLYVPTDLLDGFAADLTVITSPITCAVGDQFFLDLFGDAGNGATTWVANSQLAVWRVG